MRDGGPNQTNNGWIGLSLVVATGNFVSTAMLLGLSRGPTRTTIETFGPSGLYLVMTAVLFAGGYFATQRVWIRLPTLIVASLLLAIVVWLAATNPNWQGYEDYTPHHRTNQKVRMLMIVCGFAPLAMAAGHALGRRRQPENDPNTPDG